LSIELRRAADAELRLEKLTSDEKGLACRIDRRGRQGLWLRIDLEAETPILNSGVDAYRIARCRADESSSHQMGED
jgi:hypothetical protein